MVSNFQKKQIYYEALVRRDPSYLGTFIVGVKTTLVCCIPTCRARKPKFKNTDFYETLKEALNDGYRPCKICKPTQNAFEAPTAVQEALDLLSANPKEKVKDYHLLTKGISPVLVRRWFKKNYGITFQAYQRMLRINTAFEELSLGKKVTHAALDSGYESLSGFAYTFGKYIGKAPSSHTGHSHILISRLTTPIGPMLICVTSIGICLLEFVDRRMLETELRDLQSYFKSKILVGENKHTLQAKEELAAYFAGKSMKFNLTLDTPGTKFQEDVWKALKTIAPGETTSYSELSAILGRAITPRAVASANGANRVAIVVPCHRVLGENGDLTGYGGGLARKSWLLSHEEKYYNKST